MKKITVFLLAVFCLGMIGCSKDAEFEAFVTEFDTATKDMISKIDADPSSNGIDEAQKAFTAKKPALKAKFDAIKNAAKMQVSEAAQKKFTDSVTNNMKSLSDVMTKNAMKFATDPNAMTKFRALMADYQDTFKM